MMKRPFSILLCIVAPLLAAAENAADVMLSEDFSDPTAACAKRVLSHPKVSLAEGAGVDGSNAIRVEYVGGSMGSERVVIIHPLEGKSDFARLEFDVFFEDDWQWVRGGKMHGVGPVKRITGGKARQPDGWSSRMMFLSDGRAHNYLYDQSPTAKYGVGKRTEEPVFEKGKWHHVTFETQLNDPGEPNGWARMSVDGEVIMLDEGVNFRGVGGDETLIQNFLFSTFHGGHQPSWAPKNEAGDYVTVHALYDNFRITSDKGEAQE